MIKKLLFSVLLTSFLFVCRGQNIPKWKMDDVVKSFSANNDTVYVVNFWATFCKPCIAEIPDFIKIVKKYKGQKVKLLLVSLDLPSYYPAKIAAFAKKNNYNTNIVWLNETDADHFCPMIDKKWSGAIPSTIIVNNKTGYRKFVEDQISAEDFESAIKAAIGGHAMNKYMAPMNDAEVMKDNVGDVAHVNEYMTFKSNDSSVFAIVGGKVAMIARIEGMTVVMVKKDDLLYTYSNLGSTILKKGDEIKADQFIGYAAFDLDRYKPSIDIYISNAEKNIMLSKEDFVKRSDKKLTDHSIDRQNEPQ